MLRISWSLFLNRHKLEYISQLLVAERKRELTSI